MKHLLKLGIAILLLFFISQQSQAQYATTTIKSKHEAYKDSLKQVEYNHVFPILGKGAYKKGFDIPYPVGIMGNFFWSEQGILIENFELGIKTDDVDIPLTPVDFIKFGDSDNRAISYNVRPDLWIFPFLNVYGIFGAGKSNTTVRFSLGNQEIESVVDQGISTAGLGIMAAGGLGPVWFSVDANWTWNKPELLDEATRVNVLGIRMGHTFVFKNKPQSNIALWVGGMRVKMNSKSAGEIRLGDAIPGLEDKADEIVGNYWNWYDNEATLAQKILADKVLTPIVDKIDEADGNAIIRYRMDKQVKELWNGLLGVQYQINKHWMIRTEGGLVGDRKSFLLSLNYRFMI